MRTPVSLGIAILATVGAASMAKAAPSIPSAFWGRWEPTLADCAKPADHDDIFLIERDGFQYYETFEKVRTIRMHSPRSISLVLDGEYGDDKWSERHHVTLSPDGRTIKFAANPKPSYRCR